MDNFNNMGLDIYFIKTKKRENSKNEELDSEEVAYFRKVNFLLPFFNYIENCSDITISEDQMADLIIICSKVLDNHDLAEELLPTTSGFFFGSTDYDKDYFKDVKEVKDTFEDILVNLKEDDVIIMHCWW